MFRKLKTFAAVLIVNTMGSVSLYSVYPVLNLNAALWRMGIFYITLSTLDIRRPLYVAMIVADFLVRNMRQAICIHHSYSNITVVSYESYLYPLNKHYSKEVERMATSWLLYHRKVGGFLTATAHCELYPYTFVPQHSTKSGDHYCLLSNMNFIFVVTCCDMFWYCLK